MAGETLLIVDDDAFMRDLLLGAFTEDGYNVIVEEDGAGGISALSRHVFQVALIDLSLPDMSGSDLIQNITDGSPETHTIIMTGYPSLDTAIEAIRQGAQDYIVKPFKLDEVRGAVEHALKAQKLDEEVRHLRHRVRELEKQNRASLPVETRPQAPRRAAAGLPGAYGPSPRRPPSPEVPPAEETPDA